MSVLKRHKNAVQKNGTKMRSPNTKELYKVHTYLIYNVTYNVKLREERGKQNTATMPFIKNI